MQLVLSECTNRARVCYRDTALGDATYDAGLSATAGIQGSTGSALGYSCDTATLTTDLALEYLPTG